MSDPQKGKEQEYIWQATPPHQKLGTAAEIQKRVGAALRSLRLPDTQVLFGVCSGQPAPLQSCDQDGGGCSKKKHSSPDQVHRTSPQQPNSHADKDEEVIQVVADCLQPATECRILQLQASDLAVASIQNTGEHRQQRTHQHTGALAECEEHTRKKTNAESKQAHHVRSDGKLDQLAADRIEIFRFILAKTPSVGLTSHRSSFRSATRRSSGVRTRCHSSSGAPACR